MSFQCIKFQNFKIPVRKLQSNLPREEISWQRPIAEIRVIKRDHIKPCTALNI